MNKTALLTCEDLSVGYDGHAVSSGIGFTVSEGDYLCIVGENGAGKSTLLRTLLGLQSPLSGQIRYREGDARSGIGYLPQQSDLQRDFPASVTEVVLSGCLNRCGLRPFYTRAERQYARQIMERLRIDHLARRCYRELSGGQQQRVLLARALCAADRMILLDEPVSGLDPEATREMYAVIGELNRRDRMAVIMITHDLTQPLVDATHILHLGATPLFCGTRDAYLQSALGRRFCGEPEGDAEGGDLR